MGGGPRSFWNISINCCKQDQKVILNTAFVVFRLNIVAFLNHINIVTYKI